MWCVLPSLTTAKSWKVAVRGTSPQLDFWFSVSLPFQRVWKVKNRYQLTFGIIEMDWSVMRWRRLLLRIDMILTRPRSIDRKPREAPENFLKRGKSSQSLIKGLFFKGPPSRFSFSGYEKSKNRHHLTFWIIEMDWSVMRWRRLLLRIDMALTRPRSIDRKLR